MNILRFFLLVLAGFHAEARKLLQGNSGRSTSTAGPPGQNRTRCHDIQNRNLSMSWCMSRAQMEDCRAQARVRARAQLAQDTATVEGTSSAENNGSADFAGTADTGGEGSAIATTFAECQSAYGSEGFNALVSEETQSLQSAGAESPN